MPFCCAWILKSGPRLDWLLAGRLRRFRGLLGADFGRAMARDAERDDPAVHPYHRDEFSALARAAS
ncbi:hypothetical protein OV203_11965 [Nannocystis sp. ILAH1]|nr:hypothetical protein [Nannocystis sp. ILAH1]MCY0987844.1 hypothetical protein [Nannocystis sp. ILAH1]